MFDLFVHNLHYRATEPGLRDHLESTGIKVEKIKIPVDRETGQSRGFGFVSVASEKEGKKMIQAMNSTDFMGREIRIDVARPRANTQHSRV